MQTSFTIGDLAREFGITLRTLRFYEDKHLLSPRRAGQNRLYGRRDRARLRWILLGRRVGFSLEEISAMLSFGETQGGDRRIREAALTEMRATIARLRAQKEDVELAIAELSRTMSGVAESLDEAHAEMLQAAE